MPHKAAVIKRVSRKSFWKAVNAGINGARFSAEKELSRSGICPA
jgi:hypothetical protein